MTITASTTNFVRDAFTGVAAPTLVIPTSIPSGATLVAGIINTSDETTTLSISDPVNGAWTIVETTNSTGSTFRTYTAYFTNAGAASDAGDRTVTFTFSGAINSQIKVGWISSDQGAMTYEGSATPFSGSGNDTNLDSNTVAVSGAGGIVGVIGTNNAQGASDPTMDGAGEVLITPNSMSGTGTRSYIVFEPVASSGSYGFETTLGVSATANYHVMAFLEPGGGGTGRGRLVGGKLVGGTLVTRL